jgi:ParB family chromosome partitioning protein
MRLHELHVHAARRIRLAYLPLITIVAASSAASRCNLEIGAPSTTKVGTQIIGKFRRRCLMDTPSAQDRDWVSLMKQGTNIALLPVPGDAASRGKAVDKPNASFIAVDPARVRVWPGNARRYDRLNATNCRDLINSMIDSGGQQAPAILRRIDDDTGFDFELIAGARRHFAVSWLKANGHPHFQFCAIVRELTDEEAFITADQENLARKDVSDIERARGYAEALQSYYGGNQSRMAKRLGISKGWLSKILTVAAVPNVILEAFENVDKVSLTGLYPVAQLLDDPAAAAAIAEEATSIAIENGNRSWDNQKPIRESEVIRRLKSVAQLRSSALPSTSTSPTPNGVDGFEIHYPDGHALITVIAIDAQEITLRLHMGPSIQHEDVLREVARVMDKLSQSVCNLAG